MVSGSGVCVGTNHKVVSIGFVFWIIVRGYVLTMCDQIVKTL